MCLYHSRAAKPQDGGTPLSVACLQKEVKKLKEADKDGTQTIIVSVHLFGSQDSGVSQPFRLRSVIKSICLLLHRATQVNFQLQLRLC